MAEYCGAYPSRIKGVITVCFRDIEGSLKEIERCAKEDWPLAAIIYAPSTSPLDHPDLEPSGLRASIMICRLLCIPSPPCRLTHPGGLDTWDNYFIQRLVAHSWCGERNTAAMIGAGIMDRYPKLKIAPLEAGPGLAAVLDDQNGRARQVARQIHARTENEAERIRAERPLFPGHRDFRGREGYQKSVIDLVGEDILMYASDYPHRESWFPKSVETVMAWDMPDGVRRKFLWDNAIKNYSRYSWNLNAHLCLF